MMQFDGYVVHSVAVVKRPAKVLFEGVEIDAEIDHMEVELRPHDDATHGGGTITIRIKGPAAVDSAKGEFIQDQGGTLYWAPDGQKLVVSRAK